MGSGNIGATNVLRTTGRALGFATLLLDIAKGAFAVWLADRYLHGSVPWMAITALAVMAGHAYPMFLKFQRRQSSRKLRRRIPVSDPAAAAGCACGLRCHGCGDALHIARLGSGGRILSVSPSVSSTIRRTIVVIAAAIAGVFIVISPSQQPGADPRRQ